MDFQLPITIDNRSIIIISFIISLILAIYNIMSSGKIPRKLLLLYTVTNSLFFSGFLLLAFQRDLPVITGIYLSNTLLVLSFQFLVFTTEYQFFGKVKSFFLLSLLPFHLLLLAYTTSFNNNPDLRVIGLSLEAFLISLTVLLRLFLLIQTNPSAPVSPFILIMTIFANANLIRLIVTYTQLVSISSVDPGRNIFAAIIWLTSTMVQISWNILIIRVKVLKDKEAFKNIIDSQNQLQEEIDLLHDIFERTSEELNIIDVTDRVFRFIKKQFGITAGAFFLISDDNKTVIMQDHFGLSKEIIRENLHLKYEGSHIHRAVKNRKIIRIKPNDMINPRFIAQFTALGYTEYIAVPLFIRGMAIGAFYIADKSKDGVLQTTLELIEVIFRQVAIIINNYQLYIAMNNSEKKYRTLFDLAEDSLFVYDLKGKFLTANPHACEWLGYNMEELLNLEINELIPLEHREHITDSISELMKEGKVNYESYLLSREGKIIPVWIKSTLIVFEKRDAVYSVVRDMTDRKEMENKLKNLAATDSLTGVFNRREILNRLEEQFHLFKRHKDNLSCFIMDIDNFKKINDTYGHHVGDEVIKGASSIFTKVLRKTDLFARYGGEEFIGIFIKTDREKAEQILERILGKIGQWYLNTENGSLRFTVSIGFTSIKATDKNIDEIIKRADKALYKAKDTGKNRIIYQ